MYKHYILLPDSVVLKLQFDIINSPEIHVYMNHRNYVCYVHTCEGHYVIH